MNICNNLPLYLYSELSEEEVKEFKQHLAFCPACQRAVLTFNTIAQDKEVQSLPLNVIMDIFEKTSRKKKSIWNLAKTLRLSGALAAAGIAVGFVVFSTQPHKADLRNYYNISPIAGSELEEISASISEFEGLVTYYG
ncbi:MAG: zf-HC2 domain-containing protein [Elusimicrobiota bacterium]|jgi:anti-sigma factor RsiW|nr:zf-HC2 domain-containing protein [Elusimicrobiota bacterium]